MDRLEAMALLIATVESGSFSAASRALQIPLPTVSRKLAALEEHLGVKLLIRSTRSLTLTEAGICYLAACKQILSQVNQAEQMTVDQFESVRGDLKIGAPSDLVKTYIMPIVRDFLAAHPEVTIQLVCSDQPLTQKQSNFDISFSLDEVVDGQLAAIHLGDLNRVICASPDYLHRNGTPRLPGDWPKHAWIGVEPYSQADALPRISSHLVELPTIPPTTRLTVSTEEIAVSAAINGLGLTQVFFHHTAVAVDDRKLDLVLQDSDPTKIPVRVQHIAQYPLCRKVRSFIDFATPRLRAELASSQAKLSEMRKAQKRHKVSPLASFSKSDAEPAPSHDRVLIRS